MDYRYIEQLIERYWECTTSLEEERILKHFFSQEEIPTHLAKYQTLFGYSQQQKKIELDADFDKRLLDLIEEDQKPNREVAVKARRLTFGSRLRPLFRAVACVAIFLIIGGTVQRTFNQEPAPKGWDYNAANYQDTYQKPQEAFEAGMNGLEEIQNLLRATPEMKDSIK